MVEPAVDLIEYQIAEALARGFIDAERARWMRFMMRCEVRATTAARRRRPPSATPDPRS